MAANALQVGGTNILYAWNLDVFLHVSAHPIGHSSFSDLVVFLEDGDCAREDVKLEVEVELLLLDVKLVKQSQQPFVHV